MALRRVYFINENKVKFQNFNIKWNSGFSIQQKQKNIEELHYCISKYYNVCKDKILEVSTASKNELGRMLSSFTLKVFFNGHYYPLECVYQSSKVFKNVFGEYQVLEVLNMDPRSAKKRLTVENHNTLIKFKCFDKEFSLKPSYLFYDWLYISAVKNIPYLSESLNKYDFFTDIEFNPEKSLSCQARTLVLFIWLLRNNKLEEYIKNPNYFYRK